MERLRTMRPARLSLVAPLVACALAGTLSAGARAADTGPQGAQGAQGARPHEPAPAPDVQPGPADGTAPAPPEVPAGR